MAPRKIIWTPQCLSNLEQIAEYIAQDAPQTYMGRVVPEIGKHSIREQISKNYRIFYEVTEANVNLLGIVHSRQQIDTNQFDKTHDGTL